MRRQVLLQQVVLIGWRHNLVAFPVLSVLILVDHVTNDIDRSLVASNWRLHHLLASFRTGGDVPHVEVGLSLVHFKAILPLDAVEVLGCRIEDMLRWESRGLRIVLDDVALVRQLVLELELFVKAPASGAGTRISWSLPLPFNALDHFPGLWVDSAKRVNSSLRMHNGVATLAHVHGSVGSRVRNAMSHELRTVSSGCNALQIRITGHQCSSLVCSDVGGVLLPLVLDFHVSWRSLSPSLLLLLRRLALVRGKHRVVFIDYIRTDSLVVSTLSALLSRNGSNRSSILGYFDLVPRASLDIAIVQGFCSNSASCLYLSHVIDSLLLSLFYHL